jgi:hypothetical protein
VQARLYIDEDAMDDDLVQALRLRGVDVQTALEAGWSADPTKNTSPTRPGPGASSTPSTSATSCTSTAST